MIIMIQTTLTTAIKAKIIIMEHQEIYRDNEIPNDYNELLYLFKQLLQKHNRLVDNYNRLEEQNQSMQERNDRMLNSFDDRNRFNL